MNTKHPTEFQGQLPNLIQRVERNRYPRDTAKGVDKHFAFDYMGSSEFEWGALPKTMKLLRAAKLIGPVEIKATRDGSPVTGWYIGPKEFRASAEYWFQTTLASDRGESNFSLQERSCLYGSYGPDTEPSFRKGGKPRENYDRKFVGWLCVDGGYRMSINQSALGAPVWAIFREKIDADKWVDGLTDTAAGKPEKA